MLRDSSASHGAAAGPSSATAPGVSRGFSSDSTALGDSFRHRSKRKDDAIRKKAESELSRKYTSKRMSVASVSSPQVVPSRRAKPGGNTVASLKPAPAITVLESARIVQAAQLMAAKRADAVLVVNDEGQLSGILTDKDIAYRVVAEGLDLRQTTVSQCMTRNPVAVLDKGPRNEALSIMVSRRFRHLPVIAAEEDDGIDAELGSTTTTATTTNVVGLLDITKCVYERLDDLERKVLEDANIVAAMEALERRGHLDGDQVGMVRLQHGCPELHTVLSKHDTSGTGEIPEVSIKASVRDAAKVMKQFHQTAVLVLSSAVNGEEKLAGIFTTKDIVLRVIAASLDPAVTSVVRVMTPHPDSLDSSATILDGLKKLHIGHYQHLPVVDGSVPIGLVDVLNLTMGMLDYLVCEFPLNLSDISSKMNKSTADDGADAVSTDVNGPMWNKFWNSTFNTGHETESVEYLESVEEDDDIRSVASSMRRRQSAYQQLQQQFTSPRMHRQSLQPSTQGQITPPQIGAIPYRGSPTPAPPSTIFSSQQISLDPEQFGYKLRDMRTGKIHRFTSSATNVTEVYAAIRSKIGGAPGMVSYEDDDKDLVLLGSNADLEEAVAMARKFGWERLVLSVGEAETPNTAAQTIVRQPTLESKPAPGGHSDGSLADFLKDAPMAVNVAISAGIVVVAAFIISRMQR
ncbi:hypothetical protein HDU82_000332 [Entophlyctis luteolus]|nr:hypothetical protein HDU82_000332 [Entophlyctis luteolus]